MVATFGYGVDSRNQRSLAANEGVPLPCRLWDVLSRCCSATPGGKSHRMHNGQQIAFGDCGQCKLLVFV